MKTPIACTVLLLGFVEFAAAQDEFTFSLRTGTSNAVGVPGIISGSSFNLTTDLTVNGVDFVSSLIVRGSDVLGRNSNGLGVDGTTVNAGESLGFSVTTQPTSPGTVDFVGFTLLDFNSFTTNGGDRATINGNVVVGGLGDVDLTTPTYGTPATLEVVGLEAVDSGTTSFQLANVRLKFSAQPTAVPEASSMALLSFIALLFGIWQFVRRGVQSAV